MNDMTNIKTDSEIRAEGTEGAHTFFYLLPEKQI
jgi:hypothetical protein